MIIRAETEADDAAVRRVNESAFESPNEANIVVALHKQAHPVVSLVAEEKGEIVGYIMFSPVEPADCPELEIMGLAPMAVSPEQQRKGIGTALVHSGLEQCRKLGIGAIVVLGHPEYYARFGFVPAARFGIGCEYDVPEDVFMAIELIPGYLREAHGTVRYHPVFDDP